jgi:hypothetical protein
MPLELLLAGMMVMPKTVVENQVFDQPVSAGNTLFIGCTFKNTVDGHLTSFSRCHFLVPDQLPDKREYFVVLTGDGTSVTDCRFIGRANTRATLLHITTANIRAIDKLITRETVGKDIWLPLVTVAHRAMPENGNAWFSTAHASQKGKNVVFGIPLQLLTKDVQVYRNHFESSRASGLFLSMVDRAMVFGNTARGCQDYGLGAEWCQNVSFRKNEADSGGIALMWYSRFNSIVENQASQIRLSSNGNPILDTLISDNTVSGSIRAESYLDGGNYPVWVERLEVSRNSAGQGIRMLNSWTDKIWTWIQGSIRRNSVGVAPEDKTAIRVQGFKGLIEANTIVGRPERPIYEADQHVRGDVRVAGNRMDGRTIGLKRARD